jgi:hypothetical protein
VVDKPESWLENTNESKRQNIEDAQLMGRPGKFWLGLFLFFLAIVLGYLLYVLWPTETTAGSAAVTPSPSSTPSTAPLAYSGDNVTATATIHILGFQWSTTAELKLILLVLVMGMIGRYIHNVMSFVDFAGNRSLVRSWTWQYLLSPFHGAFLALFFYLVLRAGMLTASTSQQNVNSYGILAISGLVGLFSSQAIDKLAEIADTLFKKTTEQRGDALSKPKPSLKSAESTPTQDGSKLWLTLLGEGFAQNSAVYINGNIRESVFISDTEIKADVTGLSPNTPVKIKISNPTKGGGDSEELPWTMPP